VTRRLCAIFFLSGASALIFENLWFRQAGLAFGNSVWATSLVLSSFMGGLALGNALAARRGPSLQRPVRVYAGLECVVAATGVLLVLLLPVLGRALTPVFRGLVDQPGALNAARLAISFALLVVPATAMGLTLPVLTKALRRRAASFGENLGALYGWNTLGAVAGALAVETLLVPHVGVRGAGVAAALLSTIAAGLALGTSRRFEPQTEDEKPADRVPLGSEARRLLAAAFLTGAVLLALEVVWFRFLLLFANGSSQTFAILLAVVLLGIGMGGLVASLWLRLDPGAHHWLGALLVGAGFLLIMAYLTFNGLLPRLGDIYFFDPGPVAAMAAFLTWPVSFVSGMVFTFLGAALSERVRVDTQAAGLLTLANTTGAMLGALAGGFLLLPGLGMERSFALLAGSYGVAALLLPKEARVPTTRLGPRLTYGLFAVYVVFLALFPFGLMKAVYLRIPLLKIARENLYVDAAREGLTETALYIRQTEQDETLNRRLMTNGFSMSSTGWEARRYMGLYVYLAEALHPRLRNALLVSYGVGMTAHALTDTAELTTIDVVDISRDVLALAPHAFDDPGSNPLLDPRVRVHVEDGRAYLSTTERRFDLITSEPPPPKNAGVVNLYSQEYFALLKSRLAEGGMVTYWLPVHALTDPGTRVVVRAFCNAFADCTLWSGIDLDWMLVGTRNGRGPVTEERLRKQWRDPRRAVELAELGFESPEALGSTFLADAAGLAAFTGAAPPLTDDWPHRLGPVDQAFPPFVATVLDAAAARRVFETSPAVARLWPASLRTVTAEAFEGQSLSYEILQARFRQVPVARERLHALLTRTERRLFVLLLLGSDPDRARIARAKAARGELSSWVHGQLAVVAFSERDYARAADEAERALNSADAPYALFLRAYALCLGGREAEARPLLSVLSPDDQRFLTTTFRLD